MSNVLVGYDNRLDASTNYAVPAAPGDWGGTLPNLKTRALQQAALSNGVTAANTKFYYDLGAAQSDIGMVALIAHNFTSAATWRVRLSTVFDFASTTFDSGFVNVWDAIFTSQPTRWKTPTQSVFMAVAAAASRYVSVEIVDTTNPAGYLYLGRVMIGPTFQPAVNMSYGFAMGWEDNVEITEALSGNEYANPRTRRRFCRYTTGGLSEAEAFGPVFEIDGKGGLFGEVFFVYDPADTTYKDRRSFYGRQRQLGALEHPYPVTHSRAWEIREIAGYYGT